jgi:hypothetical protein
MPARHVPVMERLAAATCCSSPDRDLLDAIRAWQRDPQGMTLLEYTGLQRAEYAALCRDLTPVAELIRRRAAQLVAA